MKEHDVIAAIDIGTTSVKVLAINASALLEPEEGKQAVQFRTERGYPLTEVRPGHFEQDPELIACSAEEAVRELAACMKERGCTVRAISFSSAMHSLIAADSKGVPLTGCITWADSRSAQYAAQLRASGQAGSLAERTGIPVHAMTPLCKLLWMREHRPDIHGQAAAFIGIKEYILHRWCGGSYVMDPSMAGGTGLYHLEHGSWDEQALQLAGIGEERLPALVPSARMLQLMPGARKTLGLDQAVPVVVGAADGVLANVGAGAVEAGVASVTVGTSGAVRVAVSKPEGDREGRLFCYPLAEGLYFSGGAVNSGGVILRWLCEKFAPLDAQEAARNGQDPYKRLIELALEVEPGAGGLLFLPHLAGERAPLWDEDARGSFVGLSLAHDRRHMLRAGIEGIVWVLRSVAESLYDVSGRPLREIRASGGFVRTPALRQLMADILNCPVTLSGTQEASSVGAAMLALTALDSSVSLKGLAAGMRTVERCEPDPSASAVYDRLWPAYRSLYGMLAPAFKQLAAFQRGQQ